MTVNLITDSAVTAAVRDAGPARARLLECAVPQIRGMVLARLVSASDRWNAGEDIVQEVLVALDHGLGRLRTESVSGYFAFQSAIVTHKVRDYFRKVRSQGADARPVPLCADATSVAPLLSVLAASGPTPSSLVVRKEVAKSAFDELGAMSENHREVITLAIFDHLSTREIASHLGISRTSAANLLTRALEGLRSRWAAREARERSLS